MTRPEGRWETARELAAYLGARDLLIFIPDPEVHTLLPAPGFPQTLPGGREWQAFLTRCAAEGAQHALLPFPSAGIRSPAVGVAEPYGSVLVLLGGAPHLAHARAAAAALPLLTAGLRGEQAAQIAQSHIEQARAAASQA
ncbi:MAG TPA: hypothetical protein VM536_05310, partial [Chloroflexia bacterium]|nr:hypothetical protein [Chloroflexia bacterium]